jgi:hypothetical protein
VTPDSSLQSRPDRDGADMVATECPAYMKVRERQPQLLPAALSAGQLLLLFAFSLAVRLTFWPLATMDSGDHTSRIFIAWRWLEDPYLLLTGVWQPLHFYLIAPVIGLSGDTAVAPVLLHLVLGATVPVLLCILTAQEFKDRNAALAVGTAYALYPVAIRTSLEVMAQAPYAVCVGLALIALSRARAPEGDVRYAAAAGAATTLACGFRFEGWLLIPFLALALWPRFRPASVFAGTAAIWPIISMAANQIVHGSPILRLQLVENTLLPLSQRLELAASFVVITIVGVTPLLALLAGCGALLCLVRRAPQSVWLLPLCGATAALLAGIVNGSVRTDAIYSEQIGLLLIPFLAALLSASDFRNLAPAPRVATYVALFASLVAFLAIGAVQDSRIAHRLPATLAAFPAISPAPTFRSADHLPPFAERMAAELRPGDALFFDPLGKLPVAAYLALHSRLFPDKVYIPSRAPNADYDQPGVAGQSDPRLDAWLRDNCSGLAVLQPGSRFSEWLGFEPPDRAVLHGIELSLTPLLQMPWQPITDVRRRDRDTPVEKTGELMLFRYAANDCPHS